MKHKGFISKITQNFLNWVHQ